MKFSRRKLLAQASVVGAAALAEASRSMAEPLPPSPISKLASSTTLSEPGRWDDYARDRETTADVVQAVEFTLNQQSVGGGVDFIVVSDVLTIDGPVNLAGKNVTIAARRIVAKNGAAIDTSSKDAQAIGNRAQDGATPGAAGSEGKVGASGGAAGAILLAVNTIEGPLSLTANGGAGAKGQQGGQGAVGTIGAPGSHATRTSRPGNGLQGGTGGTGGKGGDGGMGGNAGQITVVIYDDGSPGPIPVGISTRAAAGHPGAVGDPGPAGKGGAGGAPGVNSFYIPSRRGPDGGSPGGPGWWDADASPGPVGRDGSVGPVNDHVADYGVASRPIVNIAGIDEVASKVPITQLAMTLSRCFTSFANGDGTELGERLAWIREIATSPKSGLQFYAGRVARAGSTAVGEPARSEIDGMAAQANSMINRLRLGLDVFGHSPNFVSPLAYQFIDKTLDQKFQIAATIEKAHDDYLTKLSRTQDASVELKGSLTTVQASRDNLDQDAKTYASQANDAQNEIQAINLTLSELQQRLQAADAHFQEALASKGGCSLGQMIQFVLGVVAIAYGAYQGVLALNATMQTVNSAPSDGSIIKDLKFVAETFEQSKITDYFKKMQEGFSKVQDALKQGDTKLVVSLDAFESQLKPYLDMPEAQAYRDQMRQFVDVAKTRNDKMLAYTQAVLKSSDAQIQRDSLGWEADRISGMLAQTNNPALSECVIFLTRYLQVAKRNLVELMDLKRRSLIYISLQPMKPSYRTASVKELLTSRAALVDSVTQAYIIRGREEQPFTTDFSLTRAAFDAFFKVLEQHGQAAFSIPIDDPQFNRGGTSFVTVQQVDLSAPGLQSGTQQFTCRLTHQGNSAFLDQDGNLMNFVHAKRPTILSYRNNAAGGWDATFITDNNLGGGADTYLYLSPFAGWTLQVTGRDNVDWSRVQELKLSFKGRAIASKAAGNK